MNIEEYNIKIKELRKERDFHQQEANRLAKEMDELVNSIDKEKINWMIGKYIKIDRRNRGGYLEFFYVDSIDARPRGYLLYGKGFSISTSIHLDSSTTIYIEDGNLENTSEITKEDFYNAFDEYVKLIRQELDNIKNYKKYGDQFLQKKSLMEATLELYEKNTIPEKVLAILKSE